MAARKYGRFRKVRAPHTASRLAASKLKKNTPGRSSAVTYVRTFNSGNVENGRNAGHPRMVTPDIQNGTTPTHAEPSNVSSSNEPGTRGRKSEGSIGQCANNRSFQVWRMTQGRRGSAHGR